MGRIAYVNGRYLPHGRASVHIEDRGYQFADGVYEVCELRKGFVIDQTLHLNRLERSLNELKIAMPMSRRAILIVMGALIRKNSIEDGLVYIQVTRGVAPRDHAFPAKNVTPALVMTIKAIDQFKEADKAENGVAIKSVPENRWERVDIKSTSLLPNVLAKQEAKDSNAYEAWFVDKDGNVTEGSSTNAWIVTKDGTLVTRPAEFGILRGITRTTLVSLAKEQGIKVEERPFSIEEARSAREAFITAASTIVMPVTSIDDKIIGNGKPGSIATELRKVYHDHAECTKL